MDGENRVFRSAALYVSYKIGWLYFIAATGYAYLAASSSGYKALNRMVNETHFISF